jgi:hypothetical protein
MEEDDMVKSMAIASYGDESMRRTGGLQARGAYKEEPRASRRLAWAALESSRTCTRVRVKRSLTVYDILSGVT